MGSDVAVLGKSLFLILKKAPFQQIASGEKTFFLKLRLSIN
jgi:hypothetical protein